MHRFWKSRLTKASDLLPNFNDYLLLDFRPQKLEESKEYLEDLFSESVKIFDGRLKYIGWNELTPDERIEYIKNNPITRKRIEVQRSSFNLLRYTVEFEGILHHVHIPVPFEEHGAVWLSDTPYYPLFPIVERGGLHRTPNEVIVKVMRAPIAFKRSESYAFTTDKGKQYRETVVTVKIHQRKRGRGGKRTDRTPLLLYHLTQYPFYDTMRMYGFEDGEIELTNTYTPSAEYSYIQIKDNIYMKLRDTVFSNIMKRRVIASYLTCLEEYPRFDLRNLLDRNLNYYWTVLGKYTYPNNNNGLLLYDNARKHLETTNTLLDPPTQRQLVKIGINVRDIYDLLFSVFLNIDNWIVSYNPTDLYNKKVGSLDQIMAPLVTQINSKLFQIINNKSEGLTQETVKRFVSSASQHESWMMGHTAFRANPTICNDCWLIAIGSKRFRSLENTETKGNTSGQNMPLALLKAHPSQFVVESPLALPPSARIGALYRVIDIEKESELLEHPKAC